MSIKIDAFTGTVRDLRKLLAFRKLVDRQVLVIQKEKLTSKGGM